MRRAKTTVVMTLVIFLSVALSGSVIGGGRETPSGEPPFGLAVSSDAPGTKLTGVAFLEFYNRRLIPGAMPKVLADVRAFVRLRQGTVVKHIFAEIPALDPFGNILIDLNNLTLTQASILAGLKNEILTELFQGDNSLDVKLKGFDEFVEGDKFTALTPAGSKLILADVVFAVK